MFRQTCTNMPVFRIMILLVFLSGTAFLLITPALADTASMDKKSVVTIAVKGKPSFYWGEKIVLAGMNSDSDSTYLFMTGPNVPDTGGKLSSPTQKVVTGKPDTFTVVKTKPDKTWEYTLYTSGILLDAGSYTLIAASKPVSQDQFGDTTTYGTTSIILKKPFITAGISPATITQGQPFTVTGIAEGIPPDVQVWILGPNYASTTKVPVNSDASFTFKGDEGLSGKLPAGQNYLIVQHPMADNQFDFVVSGDYVSNQKLNKGTNIFRITGPGCLQGGDAADALVTAFRERVGDNETYTHDTYTIIPFKVTDSVSSASRTPVVTVTGTPAGTGVTISPEGDKSYYLGEKVMLRGNNYDSDTTHLFITGPATFTTGPGIPDSGGKLTAPLQEAITGNPDSFTLVKTKPDKSWEYAFYTANMPVEAGSYTVYAASRPSALNKAEPNAGGVGIILKKPFITAEISPAIIVQGQPFTVTGFAEGEPPEVQIWLIGPDIAYTTKTPVNPGASYSFAADAALSGKLTEGQNYLIVQHPMQNNQFDIDVSGDYVRSLQSNNGTNLFRISGPGSLQGSDAADALITAFSDREVHDYTYTLDTYTIIPFRVTNAENPQSRAPYSSTTPAQKNRNIPLQYAAPLGAGALLLAGIMLWKRQ